MFGFICFSILSYFIFNILKNGLKIPPVPNKTSPDSKKINLVIVYPIEISDSQKKEYQNLFGENYFHLSSPDCCQQDFLKLIQSKPLEENWILINRPLTLTIELIESLSYLTKYDKGQLVIPYPKPLTSKFYPFSTVGLVHMVWSWIPLNQWGLDKFSFFLKDTPHLISLSGQDWHKNLKEVALPLNAIWDKVDFRKTLKTYAGEKFLTISSNDNSWFEAFKKIENKKSKGLIFIYLFLLVFPLLFYKTHFYWSVLSIFLITLLRFFTTVLLMEPWWYTIFAPFEVIMEVINWLAIKFVPSKKR